MLRIWAYGAERLKPEIERRHSLLILPESPIRNVRQLGAQDGHGMAREPDAITV